MSNLKVQFDNEVAKYCKHVPIGAFDYSVNISNKYNYLYVETPKAACSSIKVSLQRMELELPDFYREDFEDIHNRNFSPLLKPSQIGSFATFINKPNLFKFCFSRNPYTRLLSSYLNKIKANKFQKKHILMHLGKDVSKLNAEVTFAEFVDVICVQPIDNMDPHWRIQYYQTFQDSIKYDFQGKVENFDRDFEFVLKTLNRDYQKYISQEVRHASKANDLVETYYTPSLIKKVKAKFALDFDYFEYSYDFEKCLHSSSNLPIVV